VSPTKIAAQFALYAETTTAAANGRTTVTREPLEDNDGRLQTFATADDAIAAWDARICAAGGEPREFTREGASRFYEVVTPGNERSALYHVRTRRVAG
jgi:hypothetical protein